MKLVEQIGSELQRRYTYADIDDYFAAASITTANADMSNSYNSKRVYAKAILVRVSEAELLSVARDLDLIVGDQVHAFADPPQNWKETTDFRLFISHISKDSIIATRLRDALAAYDIAGFVAHEDILPTLVWQDEVERALQTMDALIAVHTEGFSASIWTQQEIGYALGRGTKIVSFKMGEDPTGFIGKHQALPRLRRTAEQIAKEIDGLLAADERTRDRLQKAKNLALPF